MFYVPSAMSMPAFLPSAPSYHPIQHFGSIMPSPQPTTPQGAWVFCPTPAIFPVQFMQQQQQVQRDRSDNGGNARVLKNPKLFKTELCRSWMDFGRCNYGDRCQYAHGEDERRSLPRPRHPKYKTEPCVMFARYGNCAYGGGCHFVHDDSLLISSSPPISHKADTLSTGSCNSSTNQSSVPFRWPSIDSLEQYEQQQLLNRNVALDSSSMVNYTSAAPSLFSARLPVFQHITDSNEHDK
uniref:C3H1-type domain-containing protein n=1 Tax=Plectus sambesii TaxID=2011161 RepID=A0A914WR99_9BILA